MTMLQNYLYLKVDNIHYFINTGMSLFIFLFIISIGMLIQNNDEDKSINNNINFTFKISVILIALHILMPTKQELDILYKKPQIEGIQNDQKTNN